MPPIPMVESVATPALGAAPILSVRELKTYFHLDEGVVRQDLPVLVGAGHVTLIPAAMGLFSPG